MARAALKLTIHKAGALAGVHPNTITRAESGLVSHGPTLTVMRQAYESAGITFIENGLTFHAPGADAEG